MQTDENMPHHNGQKPDINYSDYYAYLLQNPWIQQVGCLISKNSLKLFSRYSDLMVVSGFTGGCLRWHCCLQSSFFSLSKSDEILVLAHKLAFVQ